MWFPTLSVFYEGIKSFSVNKDFRVNEYSIELIVHPQVLSKSVITLATFSSEML